MTAPDQSSCYICGENGRFSELPPRSSVLVEDGWRVAHTFDTPIPGRLVLLPLRHVESLSELTLAEAELLGPVLARLSMAVEAVTGCSKTWVLMLAELPGFVHVHFHMVPRLKDFVLSPGGPSVIDFLRSFEGALLTDAQRDEIALRLRDALR
ncbi:MAG: HIT family protein [Candidatus Dormiibacterota bacterium]